MYRGFFSPKKMDQLLKLKTFSVIQVRAVFLRWGAGGQLDFQEASPKYPNSQTVG